MKPRRILTTDYTDGHGFNAALNRVHPCNPSLTGLAARSDGGAGQLQSSVELSSLARTQFNRHLPLCELERHHPPLAPIAGIRALRRALEACAASGRVLDGLRARAGRSKEARAPSRPASIFSSTRQTVAPGDPNLPAGPVDTARSTAFALILISPCVSTPGARPSQDGLCFLPL
jgi:hypothetical protein